MRWRIDPEVMLYDEPTTGLDPIMSDVINELILQTRQRHPVTSIVVTHDMKTAQKVGDRVVMFYPLARLRPERVKSSLMGLRTGCRKRLIRACDNLSWGRPATASRKWRVRIDGMPTKDCTHE